MPRYGNQKLKLLYLWRIFLEKTDEDHSLTVAQIISLLERYGVEAERKSIYSDIEALKSFGMDIMRRKTKTYDYYLASKAFQLPELKLLADAVASAKFITEKKSNELIKKIESLASLYEAKQLHRQIYVYGRVKTMNEKIYYNVDTLHQAIAEKKQILFKYFEYTVDKKKRYRHGGKKYCASPYALLWDDENYYLVAYYERYGVRAHFRVDKMEDIELLEKECFEMPGQNSFNPAEYSKKVFNMFGGEEEKVRLQFDNSLIGVVLDRFGKDTTIIKTDDHSFIINVSVLVSPILLGWIFSFGGKAKVLSPESLIEELVRHGRESLYQYGSL